MLAAIKTTNKNEIIVSTIDVPVLEKDEVLIKVNSCGVCGSDLHAYVESKGYEFVKSPIILGHEISGEIIKTYDGNDIQGLNKGSRVVIESMQYCGECENCQKGSYSICSYNQVVGLHFDGGLAQYTKVHKRYVRAIPDELPNEIAALSEPMAVAVHATKKLENINSGQHILVQGPGIIGIFIGLICKYKGAVVTISGLENDYEHRLKKAEKFGMTINISNGNNDLENNVDTVFECSGSNTALRNSFKYLKKGGKTIVVALYEQPVSLFLTDLVRNEWDIRMSYGCDPEDYDLATEILNKYKKEINDLISVYKIEDVNEAFEDSLEKRILKSVINIQEN